MKKLILILAAVLVASSAAAQPDRPAGKPKLTGNIIQDIRQRADSTDNVGAGGGQAGQDLMQAFDTKVEPDLRVALLISQKSGNKLTERCWTAWLAQIDARKAATVDDKGQPVDLPNPHLITDFQKIMDLRNALQPDSEFSQACQPVVNIIRVDITRFIGMVISGGAGLMRMVPLL